MKVVLTLLVSDSHSAVSFLTAVDHSMVITVMVITRWLTLHTETLSADISDFTSQSSVSHAWTLFDTSANGRLSSGSRMDSCGLRRRRWSTWHIHIRPEIMISLRLWHRYSPVLRRDGTGKLDGFCKLKCACVVLSSRCVLCSDSRTQMTRRISDEKTVKKNFLNTPVVPILEVGP